MIREELTKEQITLVVKKLIGKVDPVGETHTDNKRYNNLEIMGEVFYQLFEAITNIIYDNRNVVQWSRQNAVKKANKILEDTLTDWLYDYPLEFMKVDRTEELEGLVEASDE